MSEEKFKNIDVVHYESDQEGNQFAVLNEDDYWYLKEQAERVRELEKEIEYYRRVSSTALNDILENDETYITNQEIITQTLKALEDEE